MQSVTQNRKNRPSRWQTGALAVTLGQDMKNIGAFSKPIDAHMLISRLEGNGIAAFIRDEHMVTLDWLASNAIGGVKVDVSDEDYERALELIAAGPV